MATYYGGSSEIQSDGLQTLYPINSNYAAFSDSDNTQQPTNFLFMNPAFAANPFSQRSKTHAPPHSLQHFPGNTLQPAAATSGLLPNSVPPSVTSLQREVPDLHGVAPLFQNKFGGSADNDTLSVKDRPNNLSPVLVGTQPHGGSTEFRTPITSPSQRGLSLSLSTQEPAVIGFGPSASHLMDLPKDPMGGDISPRKKFPVPNPGGSSVSNSLQSMISSSKYLRAAQQLLDEVANVGKGVLLNTNPEKNSKKEKTDKDVAATVKCDAASSNIDGENNRKQGDELTTAQRQELQMKKDKLMIMLDMVKQKYRQYHEQMQVAVFSFEQVAGAGSATSYTQLALQRISKQFRCLKDAISAQIKSTAKSLVQLEEYDCLGIRKVAEGSRLKFVDHHDFRQHKSLQQLGLMQNNTWRPQRGLPSAAVSVLRSWLFEHFLHPYPKDSDKVSLAKQTGLTKGQVSNWFINARVRLWKPMVEEIYMEETKHDENGRTKQENQGGYNPKTHSGQRKGCEFNESDGDNSQQSEQDRKIKQLSTSAYAQEHVHQNSPGSIVSVDMDMKSAQTNTGITLEMSTCTDQIETKDSRTSQYYPLMANTGLTTTTTTNNNNTLICGGFGLLLPMEGEVGSSFSSEFHGNRVSLTLGLPHCENINLSAGDNHQNFYYNQNDQLSSIMRPTAAGRRNYYGEMSSINQAPPHDHSHSSSYDNVNNIQNKNSSYAAQLVSDFVA